MLLIRLGTLLRRTLDFILDNPPIFWACVVANLLGAVVGTIFWYGPMLLASPLWAYPFIPDCPLAAALGTVALLGINAKRQWGFFYAFAAFACIKYGLWTVAYWLQAWSVGGFFWNPIEIMLFVTHIGLFIEGLLLVTRIGDLGVLKRLAVIGWFVLSIGVDYGPYFLGLGFHPPLGPVAESFAFRVALVLTVIISMGLLSLPYHSRREQIKYSTYMGMAE